MFGCVIAGGGEGEAQDEDQWGPAEEHCPREEVCLQVVRRWRWEFIVTKRFFSQVLKPLHTGGVPLFFVK